MPAIYLMISNMAKKEKKEKEKVIYYDDGSTISDMSPVMDSKRRLFKNDNSKPRATEKEKLATFFQVFKMMLVPTGVVLLVLLILYLVFALIAKGA